VLFGPSIHHCQALPSGRDAQEKRLPSSELS